MLAAPPQVAAAFRQLLAALDAEIAELRQVGSHHFHHDAAPHESQGLLRRAGECERLRDAVALLERPRRENLPVRIEIALVEGGGS